MKPVKWTIEDLRTLDSSCLSDIQKEYVNALLNGKTCREIAEDKKVTVQYVYKVIRKAIATRDFSGEKPEYAQLTEPQRKRCVYKNFALEMKLRDIRIYQITDVIGMPYNTITNFLYGKKDIPFEAAVLIHYRFFPDLDFGYLYERSERQRFSNKHREDHAADTFVCRYPLLGQAMRERNISVTDLAVAIEDTTAHMILKLSRDKNNLLSYGEASTIHSVFFPDIPILELFEPARN